MKIFILLFILTTTIVSLFLQFAHAECCERTQLRFRSRKFKDCVDYRGGKNAIYRDGPSMKANNSKYCTITVCGDGRAVADDSNCGNGSCHFFFTCHCEYGCKQGDAVENFKELNKPNVYDVKIFKQNFIQFVGTSVSYVPTRQTM